MSMHTPATLSDVRIANIRKTGNQTISKYFLTVAENYRKNDGSQGTNFIELAAYAPADKPGIYALLGKGDLITVSYRAHAQKAYTGADGNVVYPGMECMVTGITFAETKASREARHATGVQAPMQTAPVTAPTQPVPAPTVPVEQEICGLTDADMDMLFSN